MARPPYSLSRRLRAEGYIPLPRLWVHRSDMDEIHAIARRHKDYINRLRSGIPVLDDAGSSQLPLSCEADDRDPREDRDAAWEIYKRMRTG